MFSKDQKKSKVIPKKKYHLPFLSNNLFIGFLANRHFNWEIEAKTLFLYCYSFVSSFRIYHEKM